MKCFPDKGLHMHIKRRGLAILIGLSFVLTVVPGEPAGPKSQEPPATSAPAAASVPTPASVSSGPSCIAVADVATRAAEVANFLQTITHKLAPSSEIETIRAALPEVSGQIEQDLAETMKVLQRHPALPTLQTQQQQWQAMQVKNAGWLNVLTKWSNELQETLNHLTNLQKLWAATLDSAKGSNAPGPTLQQIQQTVSDITAAQSQLKEQLASALNLQSDVSDEVAKCGTVLAKIAQIQQSSMLGILVQDSLPVWSADLWADAPNSVPEQVRTDAVSFQEDIINYFTVSRRMPLHAVSLALLIFLFMAIRRYVRKRTAGGEAFSEDIRVFDHPIASAATVGLLAVTSPYWSPLPGTVRDLFQILALVPMIILVRPVISVHLVPGLYALGLLFALDAVREVLGSEMLIGQVFLILESLIGAAVAVWFMRGLLQISTDPAGSRLRLLQAGYVLVFLVLAVGFASASLGYLRFARLVIPGVLAGGVLALALYASLRVLIGTVAIALHVWPLRTLHMVKHHRKMIEKRVFGLLILVSVVALIVRYLGYIGLLEPALSMVKAMLSAKFEHGAFSISLGNILEFAITVWAAYLLSGIIRFVLQEDVYPRLKMLPGKSYAVSSLLHYFILALGFTAAIAAMGVDLTKLTVLTGAFGVGLGFGLQSVVNNFVSGLILLFERPIHVGDTVEVGDILGKVRSIGIRASTVHTRQGADIIVPNSQLIAEKVTNWTLSDQLRRIDLPVGVSYSSVPEDVIKVLEDVARAHPQVLSDPEPVALFTGYGDSSINFELRGWTAEFDDWPRVRSALATGVYDAVRAAGMSFPFPQREVRLLKDDEGGGPSIGP